MIHLTLQYRCCGQGRPHFLKHTEVEPLAGWIRQQLVATDVGVIPLSVFRNIKVLTVNGLTFELCVDTDHPLIDEQGGPVLGICEFDIESPKAALLSVSPVSAERSEALVRSTLGHELGHALFEAPAWIAAAAQQDLFDNVPEQTRKAYRTTTQDANHIFQNSDTCHLDEETRIAEFRANEFMGSLLVPRQQLIAAVEELALRHDVTLHRGTSLDPELAGGITGLTATKSGGLESLRKTLAKRFGVTPRFIQVRLKHYGFLRP